MFKSQTSLHLGSVRKAQVKLNTINDTISMIRFSSSLFINTIPRYAIEAQIRLVVRYS